MRIEPGYIELRDVRFYAYHGVLPQERRVGGHFLVTLRVRCDLGAAVRSDDVGDTLNYAELYAILRREMAVPSSLLEHVAGRIVRAVATAMPGVLDVWVRLTKENPPMGADCGGASVELHLINDKSEA